MCDKLYGLQFEVIFSSVDKPQQNGGAERLNRIISDKAWSIVADTGLPLKIWNELMKGVVTMVNLTSTCTLKDGITPYQAWFDFLKPDQDNQPDISHLRALGCKVFVHIHKAERYRTKGGHE
jgi:hypothetical protein